MNNLLRRIRRYGNVYLECMRSAVGSAMAYRANFVITMFVTFMGNMVFPLVTLLIYQSGASFPEWSFYEVLLLQGIYTVANGLTGIMFHGALWVTMSHVREGSFEIVLLKPLSPLFYLIATTFEPNSFGLVIGGGIFIWIAASNLPAFTTVGVLQCVCLFASGMAVMAGFSIFMAATSFKWVGNSRIPEIFDSISTFGKYPLSIFPQAVRLLATFIIPVGMIGFYPASALLGRLEPQVWLAVVPCFIFVFIAVKVYGRMIKLYEGVGG